jgi:hypothetical protein
MSVKEWNVRFETRSDLIVVTAIETGRRASELRKPESALHLAFVGKFSGPSEDE